MTSRGVRGYGLTTRFFAGSRDMTTTNLPSGTLSSIDAWSLATDAKRALAPSAPSKASSTKGASGEAMYEPALTRFTTSHRPSLLGAGIGRTCGSPLAMIEAAAAQFHVSQVSTIHTCARGTQGQAC